MGPGGVRHVECLDVDVDGRLVHDAVVYPLEPVVAPPHGEMLARQGRAGRFTVRAGVIPGADEHLARRGHVLRRPERGVAVAVAPAADEQRRGLDLVVAVPNAAGPPVITVLLIGQPGEQVRVVLLQALLPKLGPTVAAVFGIGRHCVHADHGAAVCAYVVVAA